MRLESLLTPAEAAGCRGAIEPRVIMNGLTMIGIRVGLNNCVVSRLSFGMVSAAFVANVVSAGLPGPLAWVVNQVTSYVVNNWDELRIVGMGCGYWTYVYVVNGIPWVSCTRWP